MSGLRRRSGHAGPEWSDDPLAVQVAEAQQKLAEAIARAGLKHDPYQHVLEAVSHTLAVFPALVQRIEAAQPPVQDQQLYEAVSAGGQSRADNIIRHNPLRIAAIAAAALLWTAAVAGGVWYYCQGNLTAAVAGVERHLTARDAERWQALMQNNDIQETEKSATCALQNGRASCTMAMRTDSLPPPSPAPGKR